MGCESDDDSNEVEDFLMLSTNKNPVIDIDDEFNDDDDDDTTEDEDSSGDKYPLLSSSGPAGDLRGIMLGLFRKSSWDCLECLYPGWRHGWRQILPFQ